MVSKRVPCRGRPRRCLPKSRFSDIACRSLLQECADLLKLTATRAGVVEEVTELARVGLDLCCALLVLGVAAHDQNLVLRLERLCYTHSWY